MAVENIDKSKQKRKNKNERTTTRDINCEVEQRDWDTIMKAFESQSGGANVKLYVTRCDVEKGDTKKNAGCGLDKLYDSIVNSKCSLGIDKLKNMKPIEKMRSFCQERKYKKEIQEDDKRMRSSLIYKGKRTEFIRRGSKKNFQIGPEYYSEKYTIDNYNKSREKHPIKMTEAEIISLRRRIRDSTESAEEEVLGIHTYVSIMKQPLHISPNDSTIRPKPDVKVTSLSPTSAKLIWSSPSNEGILKINEYIIEKKCNGENLWEYVNKVPAKKGEMEIQIDGLEPEKLYQFSVAASTYMGVTEPVVTKLGKYELKESEKSITRSSGSGDANSMLTSDSDNQRSTPLVVIQKSPNSVILIWEKSRKVVTEYIVAKQNVGSNKWSIVGHVPGNIVFPQITVNKLDPGKSYSFRVDTHGVLAPLVTSEPITLSISQVSVSIGEKRASQINLSIGEKGGPIDGYNPVGTDESNSTPCQTNESNSTPRQSNESNITTCQSNESNSKSFKCNKSNAAVL